MSVEEHLLLQEVIENSFGLGYAARDRKRLEMRLRPRLRELHLRRFFDYYLHLEVDGASEMPKLAALITNNETYFFRETYQFEGLFRGGTARLLEGRESSGLRALSVGCSSGEEAYTLAIYARDHGFASTRFLIEGVDLDRERIATATSALYAESSLRNTTDEQRSRYFLQEDTPEGVRYRVRAPYRDGVSFRFGNLLEESTYGSAGSYDILFCRNVLIYFSDAGFRRAIELFARALRPGGLLFLGHSESLIGRESPFETVRLEPCIAYRRGTTS